MAMHVPIWFRDPCFICHTFDLLDFDGQMYQYILYNNSIQVAYAKTQFETLCYAPHYCRNLLYKYGTETTKSIVLWDI